MTRIRLNLSYDGQPFHGWAIQPQLPTVQGALETALAVALRQETKLTVAGRTDAGVHATGQVAHFDLPAGTSLSEILGDKTSARPAENPQASPDFNRFRRQLDSILRLVISGNTPQIPGVETPAVAYPAQAIDAIVVKKIQVVPDSFDARFSALARHYEYSIIDECSFRNPLQRRNCWWYSQALDATRMREAAAQLLGERDFAAFCKSREGATTIRTLKQLDVRRITPGQVCFYVAADAFCHSMVRCLVGALTEIGRGKRDANWLASRLDTGSRSAEIPLAPPQGLTLVGVDYPPTPTALMLRQQETRQKRTLDKTGCCDL